MAAQAPRSLSNVSSHMEGELSTSHSTMVGQSSGSAYQETSATSFLVCCRYSLTVVFVIWSCESHFPALHRRWPIGAWARWEVWPSFRRETRWRRCCVLEFRLQLALSPENIAIMDTFQWRKGEGCPWVWRNPNPERTVRAEEFSLHHFTGKLLEENLEINCYVRRRMFIWKRGAFYLKGEFICDTFCTCHWLQPGVNPEPTYVLWPIGILTTVPFAN